MIYYTEFKGANAVFAKMDTKDYQTVEKILRVLFAGSEDPTVLEYLLTENPKLPKICRGGRHKTPQEILAGMMRKTIEEPYARDFTVRQLEYLTNILRELGDTEIEFVHGKKPEPQDIYHKLFG